MVSFSCCAFIPGVLLAARKSPTIDSFTRSAALEPTSGEIRFEVCMSPGCIADGAQATLDKLQALAPPGQVVVVDGGCQSACGMGPVVLEEQDDGKKKIVHKRIKSDATEPRDALWRTLLERFELEGSIQRELLNGYELYLKAKTLSSSGDHDEAVHLYEKAISLAKDIALSNALKVDTTDLGTSTTVNTQILGFNGVPPSMRWIVDAYSKLSSSQIECNKLEQALQSTTEAVLLSNECDPLYFEQLARIYELQCKPQEELEALQKMFDLIPQGYQSKSPKELPRQISNRWRNLEFRKAKLERETSAL